MLQSTSKKQDEINKRQKIYYNQNLFKKVLQEQGCYLKTILKLSAILLIALSSTFSLNAQTSLTTKTNISKFQISGFIQPRYNYSTDTTKANTNNFGIRRFEVKIAAELTEMIATELTYDFGAMKSGAGGDLRDAFLKLTLNDWARIQFGQFKKPMMKEEFLTSSSAIRVIDRGLIAGSLSSNLFSERDLGIMLNGDGYEEDIPVEYWFGVFNGNGRNQASDNNATKQYSVHLEYSPLLGVTFGIDASAIGFNNKFDSSGTALIANKKKPNSEVKYKFAQGVNLELAYENFSVISEYYIWDNYIDSKKHTSVTAFSSGMKANGFYINPVYTQRIESELIPKFDVVAKYEQMNPDLGKDKKIKKSITLGTGIYLNENGTRLQLNYINSSDEDRDVKKQINPVHEIVAQFTVKF